MSIRFTCTACHTVLKVAAVVTEERKVRCTGCGIVILLTPDDDSPTGMSISVPEKGHAGPRQQRLRRNILIGMLIVALGLLAFGIWYKSHGPAERAAIDGHVNLDEGTLEKGLITFIPCEGTKGVTVSAPIVRSRYFLSAADGPHIGTNRVEIRGETDGQVAKRFNVDAKDRPEMKIDIKPGSNTKDWEVKSK